MALPHAESSPTLNDVVAPEAAAPADLRAAEDHFVRIWGQMGANWGIPRTMAEIHALLYITDRPMCTDDVMDRLSISRGNASMSLRSLLEWNLVYREHKRGDRKEYFRAVQDVWQIFRTIMRERKKREVEPAIAGLQECRALVEADPADPDGSRKAHRDRLVAMLDFFVLLDTVTERLGGRTGSGLKVVAGLLQKAI